MRRTPMPSRRTPLAQLSELKRVTPLRPRAQARPRGGDSVHARGGDGVHCEMFTPWCQGPGWQFSHRKAGGQGGRRELANGLSACGLGNLAGCHGFAHQHPRFAKFYGWFVRPNANPLLVPVLALNTKLGNPPQWMFLRPDGGVDLAPACVCPDPIQHGLVQSDEACPLHGVAPALPELPGGAA